MLQRIPQPEPAGDGRLFRGRRDLLEADVHYDLVNEFCEDVVGDALGTEVLKSLKPGEQMVGIVHRRLVEFLGGEPDEEGRATAPPPEILKISPGPTVVMMCGLQGSGKTTTCGKLAAYLKKRGRSVMLAMGTGRSTPHSIWKRCAIAATMRTSSILANSRPMHIRGPAPNGR